MKKSKVVQILQNRAKDRKVTQRELSQMIGVTEATMSRYFSGQRQPDMDTVESMARVLGCTIEVAIRL